MNNNVERNIEKKLKLGLNNLNFQLLIRKYGTLFSTFILIILLSILSDYFFDLNNFMNIFRQATIVTVIAMGLTFSLIVGGFDISVGAVAGFANVLTAFLLRSGLPFGTTALIVVAAGSLIGGANGFMIARMGINPFLATVAMLFFASGLDILISGGVRVMVPKESLGITQKIGVGSIGPIPTLLVILLIICFLCYVILNWTKIGRYFYAIGGNPRCSYISGISVKKYTWLAYVFASSLASLGGILMTTRLSSGVPLAGLDLLGNSINAAFIGMTFLTLGRANVLGTLLGGFLIGILGNGFVLLNVPFYYQYIVWGVIVVIAISLSGSGLANTITIVKISSQRISKGLTRFISNYGTPILMLLIVIVIGILRPAFFQFSNFMDILRYAAPMTMVAMGLTFAIKGGGFDISIGSIASLTTVYSAYAIVILGHPVIVVIFSVILIGCALGLINGFLCGKVGLNPFVATLAILLAAAGPQYIMSGGGRPITVYDQPFLELLGKQYLGPVPIMVIVLIFFVIILHLLLNRTKFGTYVSALGGSPQALFVSGVNIVFISIMTYVVCGIMSGLGGFFLTARLGAGITKVAEPLLLDCIAAVFLGSTFFSNGQPHILGTFAGAIFMGVITYGLTMLGVPLWGDYLFHGLMVFIAVALSGMKNN